jgi:hypothetical protein
LHRTGQACPDVSDAACASETWEWTRYRTRFKTHKTHISVHLSG